VEDIETRVLALKRAVSRLAAQEPSTAAGRERLSEARRELAAARAALHEELQNRHRVMRRVGLRPE